MNRLPSLWPVFLFLGVLFGALAFFMRPLAPSVRGEATLEDPYLDLPAGQGTFLPDDGLRGLRGGAKRAPVEKRIEYEWPAEFTLGEMQTVTLRLRDPGAGASDVSEGRARAAAALPAVPQVKILLEGSGFEFQAKSQQERTVELRPGEQSVRWGVVAVQAPAHALYFRFSTEAGDLGVEPSTFHPKVRTLFGLPAWITYRASAVFAGIANLLAVPGLMALWSRFRRREPSVPRSA